jgi:orotidine-5'-phosphate decarboxylase
MGAKDKLIVALDVETVESARTLVSALKDEVGMFKIGSQLFTAAGPGLVETILAAGSKVFLDLKFHDIPHQVSGAARQAAELGVSLFTIHASGGTEMMRRAVEAISQVAEKTRRPRSRVLAVSVLTSMDAKALAEIGVNDSPAGAVERLVKLAEVAGVDGVVASPLEAMAIRSFTKAGFLIVTPGIRHSGSPQTGNEDQKRVATPGAAIRAGSDYLVVGRPITSALDPVVAAQQITSQIEAVENDKEQAGALNV